MAGLRLLITLPYGPVTLAASLTQIRYRDFLIGSFMGDLPVVVLYSFAGQHLATLTRTSEAVSPWTVVILAAAGITVLFCAFAGKKKTA